MMTVILASLTILAVLLGPILVKPIERNVEFFFLLVGVLTACVMGQFNRALVWSAVSEPLSFTVAVLVFGAAFLLLRDYLDQLLRRLIQILHPHIVCFCLAIILGLLAAFITPVVAALVFVEAISLLRCDRRAEIAATVSACFAIGFGAGLTPLGMPGIAVVLRSLHADFWYLTHLLGPFVVCGIILAAAPILFLQFASGKPLVATEAKDSWRMVLLIRPGKVYVFIAGLVALSDGLGPVVNAYIHRVPVGLLFWMNTISAVVNNSTLAAVEISPSLTMDQQRAAFLGLLIGGGMLVPGNIPNIVAASRLGITSREWAAHGLPTGMLLLILCFGVLSLVAAF
jgi:predicted cation transporter